MDTSANEQYNGNLPYGHPLVMVEQDFLGEAVKIHLAIRTSHALWVIQGNGTIREFPRDAGTYVAENAVSPYLMLPDSLARKLLDALAAHYGGVSEARQMRKDLDAERGRVDKLLDTVSRIAETNSYAAANHPR
jgi:hypothetical protein